MAWVAPPDFTDGSTVTEVHLDILSNDLTDLNTRLSAREGRREQFGQFNVSIAAGGGATQIVTLTGFTNPPFLSLTSGNGRLTLSAAAITASSVNIGASNWSPAGTGTTTVYWHAIEKI